MADSRPLSLGHAAVTGGSSGIGAAIAEELARRAPRLTLLGRNGDRLAARAGEIASRHGVATASVILDVTDAAAVAREFARLGRVDILINNAGAAESAPIARSDAALMQRMLDVNYLGPFHCIQAVLPAMREAS